MGFIESLGRALATRVDGWQNLITGVGSFVGRSGFKFIPESRLDDQTLESIYFADAYGARICKAVPEEALRRGFSFRVTLDRDAEDHRTGSAPAPTNEADETLQMASSIVAWMDEKEVASSLVEAWTWGRLFGGGSLLIGANDGLDPQEPLDLDALESVDYVKAIDKRWLYPVDWYRDPRGANFGEPKVYQLTRQGAASIDARRVHASRIIRFDGAMTTPQRRFQNNGWSESELQRVYSALKKFNGAYEATETLLQEASVGAFKIKGLMQAMAQDTNDMFKKRMQLMDMARSVAHAILLDADGESFERIEVGALSGLPDTLGKFIILLSGASEIPVTILMGQAPAGLSATGDSDVRTFYDRVDSARTNYLRPKILRLAKIVCAANKGPTGGVVPRLDALFPSMYQLTPVEESTRRSQQATADVAYIQAGVLTPEEVALSRFRPEGWSADTTIEMDARQTPASNADAGADEPSTSEPTSTVADLAMNGAQVTSLQGIVTAAATNQMPVGTAKEIIAAAFPTLPPDRIERMLAPIAQGAGATAQLSQLQTDHASLQRSHASLKNTLKRVMAAHGIKSIAVSGKASDVSDADLDAIVSEVEGAEDAD
ncbi:MAG TPA: DUF1073 domain-containing protein, partial [Kofleriaceae bacterium]|nr:DUF1073 domain-containing protein [Kofleriaceae bacterium]